MLDKFFNYVKIFILSLMVFTSCNLVDNIGNEENFTSSNITIDKCYGNPHEKINNLEIIDRVLNSIKEEKISYVVRYFASDVVLTFDGEESNIPFAGTFYGKKNVKKALKKFFRAMKINDLVVENQIVEGEEITSYTRLQGVVPSTGQTFNMEYIFNLEINSKGEIANCTISYNVCSLGLAFSTSGEGHIISDTSVSAEAQYFYYYYITYLRDFFSTATYEEMRTTEIPIFPEWPSDAIVEEVTIAGMDGTIVNVPPDIESDKIILYIHGGGFFSGDKELQLMFPYQLSKNTNIPVLSINHLLAPENPFPAAPENCYAVYEELLNTYAPENIAITGNSSGGTLAFTTVLLAKERGLPLPGAIAPLSPWLNLTNSGGTYVQNEATDCMLSFGYLDNAVNWYLQGVSPTNPIVSPVFADISGDFPPVFLSAATNEMLLGDSIQMFEKLTTANIDVTIELRDGLLHSWHTGVGLAPESDSSNTRIADFIKEKLGT